MLPCNSVNSKMMNKIRLHCTCSCFVDILLEKQQHLKKKNDTTWRCLAFTVLHFEVCSKYTMYKTYILKYIYSFANWSYLTFCMVCEFKLCDEAEWYPSNSACYIECQMSHQSLAYLAFKSFFTVGVTY